MSWNILGIGSLLEGVDKVADDLIPSDEERLKIALQEFRRIYHETWIIERQGRRPGAVAAAHLAG